MGGSVGSLGRPVPPCQLCDISLQTRALATGRTEDVGGLPRPPPPPLAPTAATSPTPLTAPEPLQEEQDRAGGLPGIICDKNIATEATLLE